MAAPPYECLWVLLAVDPDKGRVWLRQGNSDVIGMNRSNVPMEFQQWERALNHLGGQGWEVRSRELIEGETSHEQLWLFQRQLQ